MAILGADRKDRAFGDKNDSEDENCSGCLNVSRRQQFLSELLSLRQSLSKNY